MERQKGKNNTEALKTTLSVTPNLSKYGNQKEPQQLSDLVSNLYRTQS